MKAIRIFSLFTALALLICAPAWAEPELPPEAAARIAELEAQLLERDARIAELEAQLSAGDAFADEEAAVEFTGGVITVAEARAEYDYRAYYYSAFGLDANEYGDTLKQEVLESLAEDAILRAKAEEYGLYALSRADLEDIERQAAESFEETVTYYMAYRVSEGKTDEEIRQETIDYLAGEDYTLEGVVDTLVNQTWRDRLYAHVTQDVVLTDEALEQFYASEVAAAELAWSADPLEYEYARLDGTPALWNPEGYRRVRALLVGFDDPDLEALTGLQLDLEAAGDEAEKARLSAEIDGMYAALEPEVSEVLDRIAGGEDFLALIDEYSADTASVTEPTRSEGYYVCAASEVYPDEFRDAAMALASPGDVSEPVRTQQGIYILRYEADVAPGAVPFDEVRELLAESALESLRGQLYNETVEQWLDDADIIYHPERL